MGGCLPSVNLSAEFFRRLVTLLIFKVPRMGCYGNTVYHIFIFQCHVAVEQSLKKLQCGQLSIAHHFKDKACMSQKMITYRSHIFNPCLYVSMCV